MPKNDFKKTVHYFKYAILSIGIFISQPPRAEPMYSEISQQWATYIIVSSVMPMDILVSLARDASHSNSIIVLNGFQDETNNIYDSQKMIAEINTACCNNSKTPGWMIDPLIVQRYKIKVAPSFVIAKGTSLRDEDFSVISGDIDLPNALKAFAQKSKYKNIRHQATVIYQHAFGNF